MKLKKKLPMIQKTESNTSSTISDLKKKKKREKSVSLGSVNLFYDVL